MPKIIKTYADTAYEVIAILCASAMVLGVVVLVIGALEAWPW